MRARQRHLNAKAAGAVLVLDARYITGLNNNDALTTWSDRSGNGYDMAQSNAASKPIYKTNQVGGQPLVTFDGSNDFLSTATALDWTAFVSVVRTSTGNTNKSILGAPNSAGNSGAYYIKIGSPARTTGWERYTTTGTSASATDGVLPSGSGAVFSGSRSNTALKVAVNGAYGTETTHSSLVSSAVSPAYLGAASYSGSVIDYWPGDVALVIGMTTTTRPEDSLMKRLHHHAAYSYKIACS